MYLDQVPGGGLEVHPTCSDGSPDPLDPGHTGRPVFGVSPLHRSTGSNVGRSDEVSVLELMHGVCGPDVGQTTTTDLVAKGLAPKPTHRKSGQSSR